MRDDGMQRELFPTYAGALPAVALRQIVRACKDAQAPVT
jgi:hypothetical protein